MRTSKRFLSIVLVCAMLLTSVSCLGSVFSVAAAAEDEVIWTNPISGATYTEPGNFGTTDTSGNRGVKTPAEMSAAYDSDGRWAYVAADIYEIEKDYQESGALYEHMALTDGYVDAGSYVFVAVTEGLSSTLYSALPTFYFSFSYDFFNAKTGSAVATGNGLETDLANVGATNHYAYENTATEFTDEGNSNITGDVGYYIKYTRNDYAITSEGYYNNTGMASMTGADPSKMANICCVGYKSTSYKTVFKVDSSTWLFGFVLQVKEDLEDGTAGGVWCAPEMYARNGETKPTYVPAAQTATNMKVLGKLNTNSSATATNGVAQTTVAATTPQVVHFEDFGGVLVVGEPEGGDDIPAEQRALGTETWTNPISGTSYTVGNFNADSTGRGVKTPDEMSAAYDSDGRWAYIAADIYEIETDYQESGELYEHMSLTDGYVLPGSYVFVAVTEGLSSTLYSALPTFYFSFSYDFFNAKTGSAVATGNGLETDLANVGATNHYAYENTATEFTDEGNSNITGDVGYYIKYTRNDYAITSEGYYNNTGMASMTGADPSKMANICCVGYKSTSYKTVFKVDSSTWLFGFVLQVKEDLDYRTTGGIWCAPEMYARNGETKPTYVPAAQTATNMKVLGKLNTNNSATATNGVAQTTVATTTPQVVHFEDFGGVLCVGYPPKAGGGETTTYTATFYSNDGSETIGTVTDLADGATITAPTAPDVTGYTFVGWATTANATSADATLTISGANASFYAVYTKDTYTVTFNDNDGTLIGTTSGTVDDAITLPATYARKTGYALAGWATTKGATAATITTLGNYTATTTLYAVWTRQSYNAVFMNGTATYSTKSVLFGNAISAPTDPTDSTGTKTFLGWSRTSGATSADASLGTMDAEGVTFYAVWGANTKTITWVDSEGSHAVPYEVGATVTVYTAADKEGYSFDHWEINGVEMTTPYAMPANDVTATAIYVGNPYDATFVYGDGENDKIVVSTVYGEDIVVPDVPDKDGYTSNGWTPTPGKMNVVGGMTFNAVYNANKYTINYMNDDGSAYTTAQATYDSAVSLIAVPSKSGYTALGWSTVKGDASSIVTNGYTYKTLGDTTLYAVYGQGSASYKLTVYTMNTSGIYEASSSTISSTTGATLDYTAYEVAEGFTLDSDNANAVLTGTVAADGSTEIKVYVERNKYNFTVTDANGTTTESVYYGATLTAPTAAHKLGSDDNLSYWSPAITGTMPVGGFTTSRVYVDGTFTATFQSVDGTVIYAAEGFTFGEEISEPELETEPYSAAGQWLGWSRSATASEADDDLGTMDAEGVTFYPVFESNEYTVYVYGESLTTPIFTQSGVYNTTVTLPASATWSDGGMSFKGWNSQSDGSGTNYSGTVTIQNSDIYVYAKWEAKNVYVAFYTDLDGDAVQEGNLKYGSTIVAPEVPATVDGKTFRGWYVVDADMAITSEPMPETVPYNPAGVNYAALYTADEYTVTFMYNNEEVGTQTGVAGTTIQTPAIEGVPTGYSVVWADATGAAMPATIQGNATYFGTLKGDSFNVKYYVNNELVNTVAVDAGESIPAYTWSKTGYESVSAWSGLPDEMPGNDVEVYATANKLSYALKITYTGVTVGEAPANVDTTVPYGETYSVTSPAVEGFTADTAVVAGTMDENGVDVTVNYTINQYTISYTINKPDGSTAKASDKADFGSTVTAYDPGEITGYTIAYTPAVPATMPAENTDIVITYVPVDCTATFDANTGVFAEGATTTKTVKFGAAIDGTGITEPTKEGYEFGGWYRDAAGTVAAGTMDNTAGVTLYAKWNAKGGIKYVVNTYTMDADGNYGEAVSSEAYGVAAASVDLDGDGTFATAGFYYDVEHAGYNAEGTIAPDGSSVFTVYVARSKYALNITYTGAENVPANYSQDYYFGQSYNVVSGDVTGYTPDKAAVAGAMVVGGVNETVTYTANNYNVAITYHYADAFKADSTVDNEVAYGASYSFDVEVPAGYTASATKVEGTMDSVEGKAVTVTFTPNQYALTINYVYESGEEAATQYTQDYAFNAAYAVTSPEVTGYTPDVAKVEGTMDTVGGKEITVTYSANSCTLTINYVYADGSTAAAQYKKSYDFNEAYEIASPAIAGYTADIAKVTGTMDNAAGKVVKVTYTANNYTVTYNANNGTIGATSTKEFAYNTAIDAEGITATRTGYNLLGWSRNQNARQADADLGKMNSTDGITLYAVWGLGTYTLTVKYVGTPDAIDDVTKQVQFNDTYAVTSPAVEGYKADIAQVSGTMDTEGKTVTVTYTIQSYNAIFAGNGGKWGTEDSVTVPTVYGTAIALPESEPVRAGYVFDGYDGYTEGMTIGAADVTFTAKWIQDTAYCSVKAVERTTEEYPELGFAVYTIRVEGTPSKIQIYGKNGDEFDTVNSYTYDRYSAKVTADGSTTGIISIADAEGYEGQEIWTIYATIEAGTWYVRAKANWLDSSWDAVEQGKEFINTYTDKPAVEPNTYVKSVSADKTTIVRGEQVVFTVVADSSVTMLQFVDEANSLSTGFSTTSSAVSIADGENGTKVWTITAKLSYADDSLTEFVETFKINYLCEGEYAWNESDCDTVTVTITKYDTSEETQVEGVEPYSIVEITDGYGKKLTYIEIKVKTTADVTKVRLTVDGKKATYQEGSAKTTRVEEGDYAVWTIGYRFTAAGEKSIGVEVRGNSWTDCSTGTANVKIFATQAEVDEYAATLAD